MTTAPGLVVPHLKAAMNADPESWEPDVVGLIDERLSSKFSELQVDLGELMAGHAGAASDNAISLPAAAIK
eukprot:8174135-Pyramimonas_sp.AAC.1